MEDKELYNPQNGEQIKPKRPKQFWKDWRFYVYTLIAIMLAIVSLSSCLTACAAINAGVGQNQDASYSVANRKNALTTTDVGGYDKYTFTVDVVWDESASIVATYYDFDYSTAILSNATSETVSFTSIGWANVRSFIEEAYSDLSVSSDSVKFMVLAGHTAVYGGSSYWSWVYYSFKQGAVSTSGYEMEYRSYLKLSPVYALGIPLVADGNDESAIWTHTGGSRPYTEVLTYSQNSVIQYRGVSNYDSQTLSFQDTASYYLEQGYTAGYEDGYDAGNSEGYSSGYDVGYSDGNSYGYSSGYEAGYSQATEDYNTGIAFTSYGLYANAQLTLVTDETIGNYDYMYLFDYVTSNYDEHTVYVLFLYVSSSDTYLGYVLDRNNSDTSTSAVTIGSFTGQTSTTVTITAETDQYFDLYVGYVTSFYDRGAEVIEAVWFSGGTSQTGLQNYQDGYNDGYDDGQQAGYSSGYDAGYAVGEVDGANSVDPEALTTTLVTLFQQPFNQIYRFFNFNVLGLNILGLVTGLFTVFIIWKIYKKVF